MPLSIDPSTGYLIVPVVISCSGIVDRPITELSHDDAEIERIGDKRFPTLRPFEELLKTKDAWKDKKIYATDWENSGHPEGGAMAYATNSKEGIGHITEVYADPKKETIYGMAQIEDPEIINAIIDGKLLYTSPATAGKNIKKDGLHKGKPYQYVETGLEPNHLALTNNPKWKDSYILADSKKGSSKKELDCNYYALPKEDSNMPLPAPEKNETEEQYVARFMKGDYEADKPQDQREAIAFSEFRGHSKKDSYKKDSYIMDTSLIDKLTSEKKQEYNRLNEKFHEYSKKRKEFAVGGPNESEYATKQKQMADAINELLKNSANWKKQDSKEEEDMKDNKHKDSEDPNEKESHAKEEHKLDEILALEDAEFDKLKDKMDSEKHSYFKHMRDSHHAHKKDKKDAHGEDHDKKDNKPKKDDASVEDIMQDTAKMLDAEMELEPKKAHIADSLSGLGIDVRVNQTGINFIKETALKLGKNLTLDADNFNKLDTKGKFTVIEASVEKMEQEQAKKTNTQDSNYNHKQPFVISSDAHGYKKLTETSMARSTASRNAWSSHIKK